MFTVAELHWFRKNAYNMGAKNCHSWPLPHIVQIFSACLSFIDCYPADVPQADGAELRLMGMRCHFVIGAALVSLARAEDRVDEQLQRYLEARHHVAAFDYLMQAGVGASDEVVTKDLLGKMATLFVFDFEGAICLKGWDDLNCIVRKARPCKDETMYKAMGDCLLRSRAPGKGMSTLVCWGLQGAMMLTRTQTPKAMYATMRLIVNEIYELQDFDGEKLAKYIRCMVQAVLPLDDTLALQLVDQALQIAREGHQVGAGALLVCEWQGRARHSPHSHFQAQPPSTACFAAEPAEDESESALAESPPSSHRSAGPFRARSSSGSSPRPSTTPSTSTPAPRSRPATAGPSRPWRWPSTPRTAARWRPCCETGLPGCASTRRLRMGRGDVEGFRGGGGGRGLALRSCDFGSTGTLAMYGWTGQM